MTEAEKEGRKGSREGRREGGRKKEKQGLLYSVLLCSE